MGIVESFRNDSHQFELTIRGARHSWYAFFNQILSSSQLLGEALSSASALSERHNSVKSE